MWQTDALVGSGRRGQMGLLPPWQIKDLFPSSRILSLAGLSACLLAWIAQHNYLLFHALVELFSVGVGLLVGVIALYSYPFSRNHYLAFLGCAYPWIAGIDLLHTLAYSGMNIFPNSGGNLATQLWICARYLEASVLLVAPVFISTRLIPERAHTGLGISALGLVGLVFLGLFPNAFIEGQGLTAFKIGSEYIIILLLIGATFHLYRQSAAIDPNIYKLMTASLVFTMGAELLFTFYVSVYGISNLFGHLFKLVSFVLIFFGIVHTGLREPFRIVQRQSSTYDAIPDEVMVVDRNGVVYQINQAVRQRLSTNYWDALGDDLHGRFHAHAVDREQCPVCSAIREGNPLDGIEMYYPETDEWREISLTTIFLPEQLQGIIHVSRDITRQKKAEMQLAKLNRALYTITGSNHALVHASDESELLDDICHIIVERGGYRIAWVALNMPEDQEERMASIAIAGNAQEVDLHRFATAVIEDRSPVNPVNRAIRSLTQVVINDIAVELASSRWPDLASGYGLASLTVYPLIGHHNDPLGILMIGSEQPDSFIGEELHILQELAGDLSFGLCALRAHSAREQAERQAQDWYEKYGYAMRQTITTLASTLEKRDPYTAGHQQRVADLASAIARQMGLDEFAVEGVYMGGAVHDVGKMYVPSEILNRPGRLSEQEFSIVKSHPTVGFDIIKDVEFPWPVAEMVYQHHERLDGSGYPQGLHGEAISQGARILAVADVVEAIASHRPYRPGLGIDAALDEVTKRAGTWYDPQVVKHCVSLFRDADYRIQ